MNKLKELLDQLRDTLMVRWEQFQETDTYISLRDKYDNLSPRNQKVVIFSAFLVIFLFVFMIPYEWYMASSDSVAQFEDTKTTIQELLEVSQEAKSIPPDSQTMSSDELKSKVDKILGEKGISKEQVISSTQGQFANIQGSLLIPASVIAAGVDVNLHKLNIKQVVDLAYEFDHFSPMVKILNMAVKATKEDVHYYDATYRVASFSVKEAPTPGGKGRPGGGALNGGGGLKNFNNNKPSGGSGPKKEIPQENYR
jgi:hypothetical protein